MLLPHVTGSYFWLFGIPNFIWKFCLWRFIWFQTRVASFILAHLTKIRKEWYNYSTSSEGVVKMYHRFWEPLHWKRRVHRPLIFKGFLKLLVDRLHGACNNFVWRCRPSRVLLRKKVFRRKRLPGKNSQFLNMSLTLTLTQTIETPH